MTCFRGFIAGLALALSSAAAAPSPPNLVFILADDLGWSDTTLFGQTKFCETPHIQRLAERGMLFRNAYAAHPLCSPTRASILTGLDPGRIGITVPGCHLPEERLEAALVARAHPSHKALTPTSATRLSTNYFTLAKALKEAGYVTGHFGKWHLGLEPYSALQHGFDVDVPHYPGPGPAGSYVAPWKFPPQLRFTGQPGEHIEDRMAEEAIRFIRANKDRPFYLNYWAFSVHAPFDGKKELIEKYRRKAELADEQRCPVYGAMVQSLDEAVGRLLDTLDALQLSQRTLVVFFSDNGGNMYDRVEGIAPTSNRPLRGGKATLFEGGTRVPCAVIWPGKVKPGSTSDALLSSTDFYPTILEMLGLKARPGQRFDGVSQVPALLGRRPPRREAYCFFPHYTPATGNIPGAWVRRGDWKLIRFFCDGPDQTDRVELYNLREDIGEAKDLAAANPRTVKELDALISAYLRDTKAILPRPNPAYRTNAQPRAANTPTAPGHELIGDNSFKRGFVLLQPQPGKRESYGQLRGFEADAEPVWNLAQWSSRFPLDAGPLKELGEGVRGCTNAAKSVKLGKRGSDMADISLGVNASVEYDGRHRQQGEKWVHLLLSQKFDAPPALPAIGSARLHLEARLLRSKRVEAEGYSPKIHAAQFLMFLQVQNLNLDSPGKGDYFWFGIPIYDDRHRITKEHKARDTGTKRFIFSPGGETYTTASAHDGDWITIDKDLLPLMREGLETAWERGFLKDSKDLADYHISGMNIGWEVPGIFDVEMQARNLSLKVR